MKLSNYVFLLTAFDSIYGENCVPLLLSLDNKCMLTDTMTIHRRHNDVDLICTSNEPVMKCASNCRSATKDSWKWTPVCFTCHYKDKHEELFTEEAKGDRRSELLSHCPKYGQLVRLPTECLPNLTIDSWY
jgi:hypothetical protein